MSLVPPSLSPLADDEAYAYNHGDASSSSPSASLRPKLPSFGLLTSSLLRDVLSGVLPDISAVFENGGIHDSFVAINSCSSPIFYIFTAKGL